MNRGIQNCGYVFLEYSQIYILENTEFQEFNLEPTSVRLKIFYSFIDFSQGQSCWR